MFCEPATLLFLLKVLVITSITQRNNLKGLKGEDQCENIHIFFLMILNSSISRWEKAKKVKEFWDLRVQ